MDHDQLLTLDPGMMPETIPVLAVRDLPEGVEFYQKLGFAIETEEGDEATLIRGKVKLRLHSGSQGNTETSGGIFFFVDCADAFRQELHALNIQVGKSTSDRPWRMREISVQDPDGNTLRFCEKFEDGIYS